MLFLVVLCILGKNEPQGAERIPRERIKEIYYGSSQHQAD